jgi:hypothetical protein
MNDIIVWFAGQVLAPRLADEARRLLQKRSWQSSLAKRVGQRTQIAFSRRRLRKWLRRPETANTLVSPSLEDLERLRDSLTEAVWPDEMPSNARRKADELLGRVVSEFLFALKTIDAVAISQFRQAEALAALQDQSKTIIELLDQDHRFGNVLESMPPNVRKPLLDLAKTSAVTARNLIAALHQPEDPARAVRELTADLPDWLEAATFEAWIAIAEFASAHRVEDVAASAFERLADHGAPNRTLWLGRAALQEADRNPESSRALVEKARHLTPTPHPLIRIVELILDGDWKAVRDVSHDLVTEYPGESIIGLALKTTAESALKLWDQALSTCDQVLEIEPLHSSMALHKARILVARLQTSTSESRERDLSEAFALTLRARDNRRRWKGPSAEAVDLACQIAILRGNWEAVIRLGTGPPVGEAVASEELDDSVLAKVAASAITGGQLDLARERISRIEDEFEKAFLEALISEKLDVDPSELRSKYQSAYEKATTEDQLTAVRQALAFLGEWPVPGLTDQGTANSEETDLILATSEAIRGELPSADRRLRRWLPTSLKAVNLLALLLDRAGDTDGAVDVLKEGHKRFDDGALLLRAVEALANADKPKEGEALAQEALIVTSGSVRQRLRGILIAFASARNAWSEVEKQCKALIGEGDDRPQTRWALALSLFNQGKRNESWDAVNRPPSLQPIEEIHALLLIQLVRQFGRAPGAIVRVVDVARRYQDSEAVGAAAIMVAMEMGADVEVPETLVKEVSQVSESFFEQFPTSKFLTRYEFTTAEAFSEQVRGLFPQAAEREAEYARVAHQVSLQGYPYGMLAALVGRPYSEALLRRGAGCLPILSPDDKVAAEETALAAQHINTTCFVDASVLHTLSLVPDLWLLLRTEFRGLLVPEVALRDLLMARDSLSLRSTGSLSWDPARERIRLTEITETEADDLARRSEWMVTEARSLSATSSDSLRNFPGLSDERFAPWLEALDSAKEGGRPFVCDDVGLRNLARGMRVATFGSFSVFQVMREAGRLDSAKIEALLLALTRAYGVDLPPDSDRIKAAARADAWEPRGAGFALTRPKFWTYSVAPSIYQDLLQEVRLAAPHHLRGWVFAAVTGCLRAARDDVRAEVAGSVLAFSLFEAGIPAGRVPELVDAARQAARELEVDDPLASAVTKVSQLLDQKYGPEAGARVLLGSVASLSDEDRYIVMKSLLSPSRLLITPDST